jgi:hypothetical protein
VVGVKLAIEARQRHIKWILKDDNVAVIVKRPIVVTMGCGARHQIQFRSPFLLRGGIKLFPTDEVVEVGGDVYHAIALRRLRYAMIALVDREGRVTFTNVDEKGNVLPRVVRRIEWVRQLATPEVVADGYLVFNVSNDEARIVDEEPTHVMMVFDHTVHSRVFGADIRVRPENAVIFKDATSCATSSVALTIVIVPLGTQLTVCYNRVPYRHEFEPYYKCYKVTATMPPSQEPLAETPAPDQLSLEPDTII